MNETLRNVIGGAWRAAVGGETFVNETPAHRGRALNRAPASAAAASEKAKIKNR